MEDSHTPRSKQDLLPSASEFASALVGAVSEVLANFGAETGSLESADASEEIDEASTLRRASELNEAAFGHGSYPCDAPVICGGNPLALSANSDNPLARQLWAGFGEQDVRQPAAPTSVRSWTPRSSNRLWPFARTSKQKLLSWRNAPYNRGGPRQNTSRRA